MKKSSEIASPRRPRGAAEPSGRPPLDQAAALFGTPPRNDKQPSLRARRAKQSTIKNKISVRGFTLIETLVALTIFAIGAVAVFTVFPASSMALRQAKEYTDVGLLLQSQLSLVKATPFDELSSAAITESLPHFVEKIDRTVSIDPAFAELKQVKVSVTYQSKGRSRTQSVTTYVAKN